MAKNLYLIGTMMIALLAFSSPQKASVGSSLGQPDTIGKVISKVSVDSPILSKSTKEQFQKNLDDWDKKIEQAEESSSKSAKSFKKIKKQADVIEKLIDNDTVKYDDTVRQEVNELYVDEVKKESRFTKFLKKLKLKK